MTGALRPRYTFAEYIALEAMSEGVKHEYVAGEIYARAGGTIEHAALASAFSGLLFPHRRGTFDALDEELEVRAVDATRGRRRSRGGIAATCGGYSARVTQA